MVVLDVERAEAKHDERDAGGAPGMPGDHVYERERRALRPRQARCQD